MRLKSCLWLVLAACLLLLTGGPKSFAQDERRVQYAQFFGFGQPEPEPPQARSRRYPERGEYRRSRRERSARPAEPAPQPQADYNPFAALFGAFSSPPPSQPSYSAPRAAPRYTPRYEEPRRRIVRPRPAPVREATRPKAPNVTTSIVVFGDSLAELVGQGLDDAFDEARQVTVVRRTRADSGLVQTDAYDWPKAVRDYLASPQKITVAVLMLGLNDHEPIKDGETTQEFLSDRWRQLYRERLDALLQPFKEKTIPIVFVGAPPMKNERLSTEQVAVNEIAQERVQRAGGVYVDIWPAFVDDQNRYAQMGPNLAGQVARLRLDDGIHFTKAGARKAAHFAELEIRRLIETPQNPAVVAKPEDPAVAVTPQTNVAALPAPEVVVAPVVKPAVGPVLPLTRVDVSVGGALASGRPRLNGANGSVIERAFGEGAPVAPQPGRADDFRWPRS